MEVAPQDQKPTPDSLCSACRSLTGESLLKTRPFQRGMRYMHYSETGDLEQERETPDDPGIYCSILLTDPAVSVKACAGCMLLHNIVHGGITLSGPATLRVCLRKERDQLEVEDVGKVEKERERAETANETPGLDGKGRVVILADHGSPAAQEFPIRSIGRPGSDESIAFIQRMLVECDAKHPTCKLGLTGDVVEEETEMPSRVIDVVSFDGHGAPHLLETKGLKGRYIAVSHSWGMVVKPFATTQNIEFLKKRIDFGSLPKTFQDSIFIARKLGVQYVWIDSVCIIQDDSEDWTREAKTMGLVYQKAYLTISASESPGDHAGFLTQNRDLKADVMLPYCPTDTASGYVYLGGGHTVGFEPRRTRISKRGWVIQERTLSRRILHFDGLEAHWECSQYLIGECGIKKDTTDFVNTSYYLGQNIGPLTERPSSAKSSETAQRNAALNILYHFYAVKVHEFSECYLTKASDKIPAILGLGNEISRGTGISFVDGHFFFDEPFFVYSLMWYTEMFLTDGPAVPEQLRAPSWSWAALEGNRGFHYLGQDINCERRIFLKVRKVIELDTPELRPYNALACSGRIVAAKKGEMFSPRSGSTMGLWDHMPGYQREEEFLPPTFAHRLLDPATDPEERWPQEKMSKGWVCFDCEEIRPEDLFFVPICAPLTGQEHRQPTTTRGCHGLVVMEDQVGLSDQGKRYKRLGFGGLKDTTRLDQQEVVDFLLV